ncbi:5-methyltetrahydropteroyltriglutamate--homocysteine S-methyltransferase [Bacillus aquiflavi]|uniref:5-methyltetrahydropteroyltriglutamate--homocysteine methyltransferase n=1 Tax=Bacillus aquiflavi TaxID=2672567 RepID=A0A6B3VT56_9BACI|nr:5-methyltetrahydropteroyltriglutamate--homocysteine S-methyltransferase [Bacillus aquiflavi]MBA4536024.1 5-methyltetrahydropteroyltriglutamate--homocysteine S-methyltransferase [Bacillus aquiflavi]NEY80398.1 5-methyltetrahydropteroyltriglutamate--homocysteine S-methyltransferase [Bacillus aquiflavi]UAC47690.1 5-methyltetrahydropteroyltriglutamate--homocysteine S-methyltransferase [Bacillus aquiflavi]
MKFTSTIIGYPYIGENREWKKTVEAYWAKTLSEKQFEKSMKALRLANIQKQIDANVDVVTVGDFTFYDRVLDVAVMFGMVPKRFNWDGGTIHLETYYSIARGNEQALASEMTKWFNTNYHYIVPEYDGSNLRLYENIPLKAYIEARDELGILGKPTMIGPVTFYKLTKVMENINKQTYLFQLIDLYTQILNALVAEGVKWIQFEEPIFTTSISEKDMQQAKEVYKQLSKAVPQAQILLQTYFEAVEHYETVISLPVAGIGLDFVHGFQENITNLKRWGFPKEKILVAGVINGRNIWCTPLKRQFDFLTELKSLISSENLWIQPSCSLMHVPVTVASESKLSEEFKNNLAFADEKLQELNFLKNALREGSDYYKDIFKQNIDNIANLNHSRDRQLITVHEAIQQITEKDFSRKKPHKIRKELQQEILQLPLFPTTTIGSLPQTEEVKKTRAEMRKGKISREDYRTFIQSEIKKWIDYQEKLGLDVYVHGEFERTDMVEYFGEKLKGFAFTEKAWVVSYGSRCVKPPIIYGDVQWIEPMTIAETVYAQSLTTKPVKGMLTGPNTMLNWSFVRDDIPKKEVAYQIALAIRKEVQTLEREGIQIIQVDEPALREGLPLKVNKQTSYLEWAINAFKLATSEVADVTQIHTHMYYCEFNDFIEPIRALDTDVISIETSKSHGEIIEAFKNNDYENDIGLGVYDIHSPRIPQLNEMQAIIDESLKVLAIEQCWINPDCGLKTRKTAETLAALERMVDTAKIMRERYKQEVLNMIN